jgi:uncharacterized phage protein gp47/JayE
MGTSLQQLLDLPDDTGTLQALLALLQLGGFPVTAWQSGSVGPVLTNMEAKALASLGRAISKIAAAGYLARSDDPTTGAAGAWLDFLGEQVFQDKRNDATFTNGQVVLVDAANAGPFTIQPNGLWVSEASKKYLFNSTNQAILTLPLGGSLPVDVIAAEAGAAYNLAPGVISVLQTSLPGVTVSNPIPGGAQTWITSVGTDRESDALYTARLKAKWSTIGSGSTDGAYFYNATTPSVTGTNEVTQCGVSNDGSGGVLVVVAGAAGPVSTTALTAVDAVMQAKRPLTVRVRTNNAIPSQTPFAGTVYVSSKYDLSATLSAVQVAIAALCRTVPIGGTLYVAQVIETIMMVPGVYNVALQLPATTVALGSGYVLTPLFMLSAAR